MIEDTGKERWAKLEINPDYSISTEGRIRNDRNGAIRTPQLIAGYHYVCLRVLPQAQKRRYIRVHRLAALAFVPNPDSKPQVNHINGIRTDNRVENLEWCTARENIVHGYKTGLFKGINQGEKQGSSKLKTKDILEIRASALKGETERSIAKRYNVSPSHICQIKNRKTWSHIPLVLAFIVIPFLAKSQKEEYKQHLISDREYAIVLKNRDAKTVRIKGSFFNPKGTLLLKSDTTPMMASYKGSNLQQSMPGPVYRQQLSKGTLQLNADTFTQARIHARVAMEMSNPWASDRFTGTTIEAQPTTKIDFPLYFTRVMSINALPGMMEFADGKYYFTEAIRREVTVKEKDSICEAWRSRYENKSNPVPVQNR